MVEDFNPDTGGTNAPWRASKTDITSVVIGGKVSNIGEGAFYKCNKITDISMTNVKTIGESAFYNCSGLKSLNMPSATTISESAFSSCLGLTDVSMPEATKIDKNTFFYCSKLKTVYAPKVTLIGDCGFQNCASLTDLTLSNELTSVNSNAFYGITNKSQIKINLYNPSGAALSTAALAALGAAGIATATNVSPTNVVAQPTSYTVTYNANGATSGSVPTDNSSPYASGGQVTVLGNTGNLTKTNCTFAGWNTNSAGTGTTYQADSNFNIATNTILYAKWTDNGTTPPVTPPSTPSTGGGYYTPTTPTITITDETGGSAAAQGKATFDSTTGKVTIAPAEGYEIKDVTVNGKSMGQAAELTGIKGTDVIKVVFEKKPETPSKTPEQLAAERNAKLTAGVKATRIIYPDAVQLSNGKVKLTFKKTSGYKTDAYRIYRSAKKTGGFKKAFETKNRYYITGKDLKAGITVYFKVRGLRKIDGETVFTQFSRVESVKIK